MSFPAMYEQVFYQDGANGVTNPEITGLTLNANLSLNGALSVAGAVVSTSLNWANSVAAANGAEDIAFTANAANGTGLPANNTHAGWILCKVAGANAWIPYWD